jgi:Spy/CpxP family protein refolding chaperone
MPRRLRTAALAFAVTAALAGAAIAHAASSTSSKTAPAKPRQQSVHRTAPAAVRHHSGNCPHMHDGSGNSSDSSAPSAIGV